jgi:hypothetical protein
MAILLPAHFPTIQPNFTSSSLLWKHASVYSDDLVRYVASFDHPEDGVGDLAGRAEATDWNF